MDGLTSNVEEGPDTCNKDEEVLQRLGLRDESQDPNDHHRDCADDGGDEDNRAASHTVRHKNETDGRSQCDGGCTKQVSYVSFLYVNAIILRGQHTHDSGDKEGVVKATLTEEDTGIGVEKRQAGELLGADRQSRADSTLQVRPPEAIDIRADKLLPAHIHEPQVFVQASLFESGVLDDSVFGLDVITLNLAEDTAE